MSENIFISATSSSSPPYLLEIWVLRLFNPPPWRKKKEVLAACKQTIVFFFTRNPSEVTVEHDLALLCVGKPCFYYYYIRADPSPWIEIGPLKTYF